MSVKPKRFITRLRRWRRRARWARESAAGDSNRGQRGDPACGGRAREPRLLDPQANRTVRLHRSPARQGGT
jgi:hypothetical protein